MSVGEFAVAISPPILLLGLERQLAKAPDGAAMKFVDGARRL